MNVKLLVENHETNIWNETRRFEDDKTVCTSITGIGVELSSFHWSLDPTCRWRTHCYRGRRRYVLQKKFVAIVDFSRQLGLRSRPIDIPYLTILQAQTAFRSPEQY